MVHLKKEMKSFIRKLFFAKSYLYLYPYSSLNLDNDLERIYEAEYFDRNTILRGKDISKNQFSLWEKWNLFRGYHSFDALGFFSGTKFNHQNRTYIIGTIYPNPIMLIGFYFTTLTLGFILYSRVSTNGSYEILEMILPIGILSIVLFSSLLYFRRRIGNSVEQKLKIKKTHHNKG
ncbi:hypothetical protein TBC1_112162 [Lentimicrobium saccharophilum]|uniref:Uncharacterized protein n=1 Tax=Lentimicrobium saccharophilum TaxID=1678841 RepID=A0A0S7C4W9_9BACT|nr:hypothetical protein TBC1_112162 [Lentimicrobium saccharophilum]